jgi:hypothetical protein
MKKKPVLGKRNPPMIYIVRFIHSILAIYLTVCTVVILYAAFTVRLTNLFYLATVSLLIDGIIIYLNHGDCPMEYFHYKFGDDKTFFELFLPKKIAKQMFNYYKIFIFSGYLLLAIRIIIRI